MFSVVCFISKGVCSYRTHSTTAIYVVHDMTTIDIYLGITHHDTGVEVVVGLFVVSFTTVECIRTATATIHIATIRIACATISLWICYTDGTTMYSHLCILVVMSVLTTAIDRTGNLRIRQVRCSALSSNYYISITDPGYLIDIVVCFRIALRTTRRTEYHTVLLTVRAERTTCDGNISSTSIRCTSCRESFSIKCGECTHRTERSTAIDVMDNLRGVSSTRDGDIGITLHESCIDIIILTFTTTKDVAPCCTALTSSANRTASNSHFSITINT